MKGMIPMRHSSRDRGKDEFPIYFDSYQHMYNGTWFRMKNGYTVRILNFIDKDNVEIEFLNVEFPYKTTVSLNHIKNSGVRYPFERNRYGGYCGIGPYSSNTSYRWVWENMLARVYTSHHDGENGIKASRKNLSYYDTAIDESWYCFQTFADWYCKYLAQLNPNFQYELDKDILQWNFEQKIYGPSTCCLIPHEINVVLIDSSNSQKDLPIGVELVDEKYFKSTGTTNGKHVYLGLFDSAEKAFETYRNWRISKIRELADYYFSMNAITSEIKIALYAIDISPYGNGRRIING